MADNKKELLERLTKEAHKTKEEEKATALQAEINRCRAFSTKQLGQEKMMAGKFAGKTVAETYQDTSYVIWIVGHQTENVRFINLIQYAARVGEETKSGTNAQSSGEMLKPTEKPIETDDWEDVTATEPVVDSREQLLAMIGALHENFMYLKNRIDQLGLSHQQQQVAQYQAASSAVEIREKLEEVFQRVTRLEGRDRSRTPHGQVHLGIFHTEGRDDKHELETVPEEGVDFCVEDTCDGIHNPKEDVGTALDLSYGNLGSRKQGDDRSETFQWQKAEAGNWETVSQPRQLGKTRKRAEERDELTCLSYFASALQERSKVFEIVLDIQPRDVHKARTNGTCN